MAYERFDKFTERARRVLTLAQEEAQRFNHNYIGTEHLLLGLIADGGGIATKVLINMGAPPERVRASLEFLITRNTTFPTGEVGLTPRARKVIELATDESFQLRHHYIGTEHLLLGLVRERDGIAAGVLATFGISSFAKVRAEIQKILNPRTPAPLATTIGSDDISATFQEKFDRISKKLHEARTILEELEYDLPMMRDAIIYNLKHKND
jgi:ATP-dependent Clp protease ATP-binding subunit ClpC